jgi:hypothetical protein
VSLRRSGRLARFAITMHLSKKISSGGNAR